MSSKPDKAKKSSKKDDDKKSSRSKSKDAKSDKDAKSAKSSKSKDKSSDAKSVKSDKSKTADKKKSTTKTPEKSEKGKKTEKDKSKEKKADEEEKKEEDLNVSQVQGALADAGKSSGFQASGGPFVRGGTIAPTGTNVQTTCLIHGGELKFYCENTESLICHDCTIMGPHNTQLHRISKMDEAFSFRFQTLNKTIRDSLVPKRTQLVGQIVRLDTRLDEVKSVKQVIERDIRNEYAGIIERLKSAEGVKTAVLSHDLSEVQQDITRIDEILMFMEEITRAGPEGLPDQIAFLHHFRQLNENIEYAITKQFKVDIEVYPNDLPRELAERNLLLEHYEEQRRLLKLRDDMIWEMSQEIKKKYDCYQDEFDKETRQEMEEWAKLVDKYAGELQKFDLVCAFCGSHMSDQTVNTDCLENNSMFDSYTYFTIEEPMQHFIHKSRHWFGKPALRNNEIQHSARQSLDAYADQRCDAFLKQHQQHNQLFKKLSQNITGSQLQNLQRNIHSKEDLVNGLFELIDIKKVKPADVYSYINLFFEENYREAPHVLIRFQQASRALAPTERTNNSRQLMSHRSNNSSRREPQRDRDVHLKVREAVENTDQGVDGLEIALKSVSSKHNTVNRDQLLIALTRLDTGGLAIDDVKDFFTSFKGNQKKDDYDLDIDEIMQVLHQ